MTHRQPEMGDEMEVLGDLPDVLLAVGRLEARAEAGEPVFLRGGVAGVGGDAVVVLWKII